METIEIDNRAIQSLAQAVLEDMRTKKEYENYEHQRKQGI